MISNQTGYPSREQPFPLSSVTWQNLAHLMSDAGEGSAQAGDPNPVVIIDMLNLSLRVADRSVIQ